MYQSVDTILVPVDFSEQSLIALRQSYNIANYFNAKIILLHVITGKLNEPENDIFRDDLDHINDDLVRISNDVKKESGQQTEIIIEKGRIVPTIIETAKKINSRFIFIGNRKQSIGPVTMRLIKEAPCPVFSIKGVKHRDGCKRIILPLDLTKTTTEKVRLTYELAKFFRSQVNVVSAYTPEDKLKLAKMRIMLEQVREYFVTRDTVCTTKLLDARHNKNEITGLLLEYSEKVNGDLIIIMIQQENALKKRIIGSLAKKIIMESEIPVLCIRPDFNLNQ